MISEPEWGCRLCWVIWTDHLITRGSLKSFTWIGNKFSQSSSSYRFFLSPHYYTRAQALKISKDFEKSWGKKKCKNRNAHPALIASAPDLSASLTHWTSLQRFEHEIFWFPFVIPSSSNYDSCCRQWLTRQCSFAQLNILMTKSTRQICIDEISFNDVDQTCETAFLHHPMQKNSPADENPAPPELASVSFRGKTNSYLNSSH